MTRCLSTLALVTLWCTSALAQDRVVLVASAASPIDAISSFETRKIYLGIGVFKDGRLIVGLRNQADRMLTEVFLQSVVGLSEERYERRLLSNVFKYGTLRPEEFSDVESLTAALAGNPYAVSYLWVTDGVPPGLRVLRVLWQGL